MAEIICPSCGKTNNQTREFCFYCQARLEPLEDGNPQSGSSDQGDIPPSEKPAIGSEPLLPAWLQKSRLDLQKTLRDETGIASSESPANLENQDLLAGLRSTASDEDDALPEWLANITGESRPTKKTRDVFPGLQPKDQPGAEPDSELTSGGIPATQAPRLQPDEDAKKERDSMPAWLAQLQSNVDYGGDELTDWLEKARLEADTNVSGPPGAANFEDQDSTSPKEAPSTEWLSDLSILNGEISSPLTAMDNSDERERGVIEKLESDNEWLARLGSQGSEEQVPAPESSEKLPPWLRNQSPTPEQTESRKSEIPEWLQAAAPSSTFEDAGTRDRSGSQKEMDWPRSEFPAEPPKDELAFPPQAEDQKPSALSSIEPPQPQSGTPFAREPVPGSTLAKDPLSDQDMESLFTELPDWLSKPGADQLDSSTPSSPGSTSEAISPASLPSWVQAMRPVESISRRSTASTDQTLESKGALAGLQGVLPTMSTPIRSVVPTKVGIKLSVNEEQHSHAALFERILEAETISQPVKSIQRISIQKLLGWTISALLIVFVTGLLLTGSRVFRLPVQWPVASTSALQVVESLPENSPVLVIVDYEPARSAEMEAVAVPLLDHMILLRHPRLALISTKTTGNLLAEKLITGSFLAGHNYQTGSQYIDLGFLPGGLTGVLAFSQDPVAAKPLDFNKDLAWTAPALQGVTRLSDFAALILLTDDVDSARVWIEQAGPYRGSAPFVLAASAQAAPMIQPYVDSRQVSGLVSGLSGAAMLEHNNASRPGTARIWWDAYSLGLVIAASMILGGGAWNLVQGIRTRWSGEPV